MKMYEELVKSLRDHTHALDCEFCDRACCYPDGKGKGKCVIIQAADAIEEMSSQLEDFKRLCLPLKENRLYKFADGSFTEVTLMIVPREPTEPPKEET